MIKEVLFSEIKNNPDVKGIYNRLIKILKSKDYQESKGIVQRLTGKIPSAVSDEKLNEIALGLFAEYCGEVLGVDESGGEAIPFIIKNKIRNYAEKFHKSDLENWYSASDELARKVFSCVCS